MSEKFLSPMSQNAVQEIMIKIINKMDSRSRKPEEYLRRKELKDRLFRMEGKK